MSNDGDWLDSLHRVDPWIAAITPQRIEKALAGFSCSLANGWDTQRLTQAIQDKANLSREATHCGPQRQSNADARNELQALAVLADKLEKGIKGLSDSANHAAFWEAFGFFESREETLPASPAEGYFTFSDFEFRSKLIEPLANIAAILDKAAWRAGSEPQAPRWRESETQWLRVRFAIGLTPVFENAFDMTANATNWPASYGVDHPWPDFYRRMHLMLHPETCRLNLAEVLQLASARRPSASIAKHAIHPENSDE